MSVRHIPTRTTLADFLSPGHVVRTVDGQFDYITSAMNNDNGQTIYTAHRMENGQIHNVTVVQSNDNRVTVVGGA